MVLSFYYTIRIKYKVLPSLIGLPKSSSLFLMMRLHAKEKKRDETELSLKLDLDSKAELVTLVLPGGGEYWPLIGPE